jgi:hypothetical protein
VDSPATPATAARRSPASGARFFPLSGQELVHRRLRPRQLRTAVGVVELEVLYGQDPTDRHWGCPTREHWGLTSHQQLSLAREDQLAFTLTATGSYEEAAAVAAQWGTTIRSAALQGLAQRLGSRAEARTQGQLTTAPTERQPQRAAPKLAVLMLDGWQVASARAWLGEKESPATPRGMA